jgi:hypothetical protein
MKMARRAAGLAVAGSTALPHCNLGQHNRTAASSRSIAAFRFARKREDLRLDIERKRAMFPEHKISRPGFFRFVADIWRMTYGLSRYRHSAFQMVEDFQKTVTDPGSRKLSGGTADEDTRRSRVSGQEDA